jgi:hypothetical protein
VTKIWVSYDQVPFAEREADLRRMLGCLPIARLSIGRSGIGMNRAENPTRDFPQVAGEAFSNESKERWATDLNATRRRRGVERPSGSPRRG